MDLLCESHLILNVGASVHPSDVWGETSSRYLFLCFQAMAMFVHLSLVRYGKFVFSVSTCYYGSTCLLNVP